MWDLEVFVDYDYLNMQDSKGNRIIVTIYLHSCRSDSCLKFQSWTVFFEKF